MRNLTILSLRCYFPDWARGIGFLPLQLSGIISYCNRREVKIHYESIFDHFTGHVYSRRYSAGVPDGSGATIIILILVRIVPIQYDTDQSARDRPGGHGKVIYLTYDKMVDTGIYGNTPGGNLPASANGAGGGCRACCVADSRSHTHDPPSGQAGHTRPRP